MSQITTVQSGGGGGGFSVLPWTPVLQFGGSSVGVTYTTQQGFYQLVGNVVYYQFILVLSSVGSYTSSDIATIIGMPTSTSNSGFSGSICNDQNMALAAGGFYASYWFDNSIYLAATSANFLINDDQSPDTADSQFTNWSSFTAPGAFSGSGFYFTT